MSKDIQVEMTIRFKVPACGDTSAMGNLLKEASAARGNPSYYCKLAEKHAKDFHVEVDTKYCE